MIHDAESVSGSTACQVSSRRGQIGGTEHLASVSSPVVQDPPLLLTFETDHSTS